MDRENVLSFAACRETQVRRAVARQRDRILVLEAAGCSTRNAHQTLEVLLTTLAILERRKLKLLTQGRQNQPKTWRRLG
jgi:hypothetical protein